MSRKKSAHGENILCNLKESLRKYLENSCPARLVYVQGNCMWRFTNSRFPFEINESALVAYKLLSRSSSYRTRRIFKWPTRLDLSSTPPLPKVKVEVALSEGKQCVLPWPGHLNLCPMGASKRHLIFQFYRLRRGFHLIFQHWLKHLAF